MAYTQEGKLSLRGKHRSPENLLQIDCSEIAATFREGGGHPGAAGGFLKTNVDKNGDNAVLVEIESNLQNYFEKLEQYSLSSRLKIGGTAHAAIRIATLV
jgi:nanoRNase/pAp phosphatase (c-di-AMP/oligoRNAs hydrolase)